MPARSAGSSEFASQLEGSGAQSLTLKGVAARVTLRDLIAQIEIEQHYENPSDTNVELVYTFPLPIGAVLMGMELELADRRLAGMIVERKEGERKYEDAIVDGDLAMLLEEVEEGMFVANLGNLMAGEKAVIRYRFALPLEWQGDKLRLLLPTTIAPRYGSYAAAGFKPHQEPISSLSVEYPLAIEVLVEGELARGEIGSPSHPISVARTDTGCAVRLAGESTLDRDFVLTILQHDGDRNACRLVPNKKGYVAHVAFQVPTLESADQSPLNLKLVIDCSGSMAGTSITQARKAALAILDCLRPSDRFSVSLFGSHVTHLFGDRLPMADAETLAQARRALESLSADMGDTELQKALCAVFALGSAPCEEGSAPSVLLVTDGEIADPQQLLRVAAESGHRVFTIGVGNAVAEGLVRELGRVTGGACELVAPREGMSERVLAQFHRLRQAGVRNVTVDWPQAPVWSTPPPKNAFGGDTLHLFAEFEDSFTAPVRLSADCEDGPSLHSEATVVATSDNELARIAAASRIRDLGLEEALPIALEHQLMCEQTHCVIVEGRLEKAGDLPSLQRVAQMLAAGWGGVGSEDDMPCCIATRPSARSLILENNMFCRAVEDPASESRDLGEAPLTYPRRVGLVVVEPHLFVTGVCFMLDLPAAKTPELDNFKSMESQCLPQDVMHTLRELTACGWDERTVVASFLEAIVGTSAAATSIRGLLRKLRKYARGMGVDPRLVSYLAQAMSQLTPLSWNWAPDPALVPTVQRPLQ